MNVNREAEHLINQKLYIAPIKNKGLGVFASKPIRKGELIFSFSGVEFRVDDDYKCDVEGYWFQIGDKQWLDDKNYGKFVNHSCNPNSAIFNSIELKSIKDIKPGEEINVDYDATEWDNSRYNAFICKCGDKNCRGIIQGYKYLPEIWKRFYKKMGIVPNYLLEMEKQQSIMI